MLCCPDCGFILVRDAAEKPTSPPNGMPAADAFSPGQVLQERYAIERRIGAGAHGVTYLARHQLFDYQCVIKAVASRALDPLGVERIRNEARVGMQVNSPTVVRVLDFDETQGRFYFVMEFVRGADLLKILAGQLRLPWRQAARLLVDAGRGLAAIHAAGLIHRDVKPSNLILGEDGRLRVADLSLAAVAGRRSTSGRASSDGTVEYAAPEMFAVGESLSPLVDLYSLGATFFHLMTGRLPHDSGGPFQQLLDIQAGGVRWPDAVAADVPAWLREIILKLLRADPAERFHSAVALVESVVAGLDAKGIAGIASEESAPADQPVEPRGVLVLPFEGRESAEDAGWIGLGLSMHISQALARTPGVYVVDADGFAAVKKSVVSLRDDSEDAHLVEAARIVGAGTVITGEFRCTADHVTIHVNALRVMSRERISITETNGPIRELSRLQDVLFGRILTWLDYARTESSGVFSLYAPEMASVEDFIRGKQAYLRGDYEAAIRWARRAVDRDPNMAEAIGCIGICFGRLGRYDQAEECYRRQIEVAREHGDRRQVLEAYANLGVMNYFRGEYEAASQHYETALKLADELGRVVEGAQIRNNLGFVLFRLNRLDEAKRAFAAAIDTQRAYGALAPLVGPYNGIGNVLAEQRRFEEAIQYYHRARSLAQEIGDRASVGTSLMHLGRCEALRGNPDAAKRELTAALSTLEETRFWNGLARAYEYIAELDIQSGDHVSAVRCADRRVELARRHANKRMERAAWLQKAGSLDAMGYQKDAAECRQMATQLAED